MKRITTKVRNLLAAALLSVLFLGLLGGCQGMEDFVVDSRVNYVLTVPESTGDQEAGVSFQTPFYRVFLGEEPYDGIGTKTYTVGQEAVLYGEHVEQLKGAGVWLGISDFSEHVDDNFYKSVARGVFDDETKARKVKKELAEVVKRAKILSANFVFEGSIYEDVRIDRLEIPAIGFSYTFDQFLINTCEFEEGAVTDTGKAVDDREVSGSFLGEGISVSGDLPIAGTARMDIQSIEISSLNDLCTVIDEENYEKFGAFYSSVNEPKQLTDYRKGDPLALSVSYVFDGMEQMEDYDAAIASLLVKYQTASGENVWSLHYQPTVRDGKYLLISHYDEIMH